METPNIVAGDVSPAATATAPSKPGTVTDARGRVITIKLLNPLEQYRLARAMGAAADSDRAMALASYAACVRVLDGEPQPFPNTDREVQAMLQRLDTAGIDAVQRAIAEMGEAASDASKTDGTEAIKN